MLYLEKVIAIIENNSCLEEVLCLGQLLQQQGLEFEGKCAKTEADVCHAETSNDVRDNSVTCNAMSCLWLSDSELVVNRLRQDGHAVLAILHEENREQDLTAALYACESPGELDADFLEKVFRRYTRLPWDILETERCYVRETVPEDAEDFFGIYHEASITRYTDGLFSELDQEKQYIEEYIDKVYRFYNFGVWTILKKETGEVIGRAGFSFREGFEEPELGYVIGLPWQGQGYATEICREILQYGFEMLGFTAVHAFVRAENAASLAICRKLGMTQDGDAMIGGIRHLCMRISLSEWEI